jgi:DHA1 family solute carrier family 18 vesicular amine transporter 1/2
MGPPIGGALYQKLGFHAPFIFCLGMNAVDFIGRLIVIEKKDVAKWSDENVQSITVGAGTSFNQGIPRDRPDEPIEEKKDEAAQHTTSTADHSQHGGPALPCDVKKVSQLRAVCMLLRSPRAIAALLNTFIFG